MKLDSASKSALPKEKGRRGPKVEEGWQERFLDQYRRLGVRWVAARQAKVSHDTVSRAEHEDPIFAAAVEAARQEYCDGLEQTLDRLAREKNNVIAAIVLAKKHRPQDFIERKQELHVHAHAGLTQEDGRRLLSAMLANATSATLQALAEDTEGRKMLDVGRLEDPPIAEGPTP